MRPGSIAGSVYVDADDDGVRGTSEVGIAGVTVTLTGTDDRGSAVTMPILTDASGAFTFGTLRPGTYTLTQTHPVLYLDGLDASGTLGGAVANDVLSAIVVTPGASGTRYTFGENTAGLYGTVFIDRNLDGLLDAGDSGRLGGVLLTLRDASNAVVATATTAANGSYAFVGLTAGNYTVEQTQPIGYSSSTPNVVAVTLPVTGLSGVDFGETTATLSGIVFHDLDDSGTLDGSEPRLSGVTLTLTGTDLLGAPVTRTATTLGDGSYTFTDLLAGTYTLTETQPAGFAEGRDIAGTAGGDTSVDDRIASINLGAGANESGYLFAERTPTDLVTTKTNGVTTVRAGQLVTYTVTVSNVSTQRADAVLVTDQFPTDALEFISASNGGVFDPQAGTITWNLGALAGSGGTVTLTIDARVRTPVPASVESVTNTVTAIDSANPGADPTPENNAATDTDPLPARPDLSVVKTASVTEAKLGATITFTFTGGNAGDQSAAGVIVADALPPGLRFVAASNGGRVVGGRVEWALGTLRPGDTYALTLTVVVEQAVAGNFVNTATITDATGNREDPTPFNNTSTVPGRITAALTTVQPFAFDGFNNFARGDLDRALDWRVASPEVLADAILPLQPIYSGEADPGSTLLIELFNSRGAPIGSQTVVTDTGGNWLATFPSTILKDAPNTARITQIAASYGLSDPWGHNLRTYFTPAINTGHFFLESRGGGDLTGEAAPLLGGLGLEQPLQLGVVKYGGEFLTSQATASGR